MDNKKITRKQMVFSSERYNPSDAIPDNKESEVKGKYEYISYGSNNRYPQYLYSLYEDSAPLTGVIDGTRNCILGLGIEAKDIDKEMNNDGDTLRDIIGKAILDKLIYGGFAIQIINNGLGKPVQYINLDFERCRVDEDLEMVFYSKKWGENYKTEIITYPTTKSKNKAKTKVFYNNGSMSKKTYPKCPFNAVIKEIETLKAINTKNFNAIKNNISASAIISYNNNSLSTDEEESVGKEFKESFTGSDNQGKVITVFGTGNGEKPTLEIKEVPTKEFDIKTLKLQDKISQDIYNSYNASSKLFGRDTETLGFNNQEFQASFSLYNKQTIVPLQNEMTKAFKKIDIDIEFKPFKIDLENEENTNIK